MTTAFDWTYSAQTWFESIPSERLAYAVVDMANVHSEKRQVLRILRASGALNILGDNRPEAEEAIPWLLPLTSQISTKRNFKLTLDLANRSACVTWLASELPPQALAQALNDRTQAELPDHYRILLRCYDPRVLSELLAVLGDDQAEQFWGMNGQWCYVDRTKQFKCIELQAPSQDALFEPPLLLTQEQTDQLLAAAEVDQVMPELVRETPNAFLAIAPHERAAITRQALRKADDYRLESFSDRVVFCILGLELGQDFDQSGQWPVLMRRVTARELTLTQAVTLATRP
ncbi:MAG: DUF4123 domain-containing protein [Burkholderiales bacterium]|nr:DUF4123 domain-containing protein [Burkholderiales bacterium]